MNKKHRIDYIEHRVRMSHEYYLWVKRNKGVACACCDSRENLVCHHHGASLRHTIIGFMTLHSDEETINLVISMHEFNEFKSITLCDECHKKSHRMKLPDENKPERELKIEPWCVIPHPINIPISPSRSCCPSGSIGLVAFQTLLGIGYHFLSGNFFQRIGTVNHRRFAELLGKKPSTSFAKLLHGALIDLRNADIVAGHTQINSNFEIHLTKEFVNRLKNGYWFISQRNIKSSRITSLAIKHILLTQQYSSYSISMEKLCNRIGLSMKNPSMARQTIRDAVNDITWASVKIEENVCRFNIFRRGSVPVRQLREMLYSEIMKND